MCNFRTLRVLLHQASVSMLRQCCDDASHKFLIEINGVTQSGIQPQAGVTPLFSIRTASLASSQNCRSVDSDSWCKRTITIARRFVNKSQINYENNLVPPTFGASSFVATEQSVNNFPTRMHSSRMRTAHLLPVSLGMHCSLGGGVPGPGVAPGPGGSTWSWGVYLVPGDVPGPGGCTWSWEVYLVRGDVPAQALPPPPQTESETPVKI